MERIKKVLSALIIIIFFILILIFCYFFMNKNPNTVFVENILLGIMLYIVCNYKLIKRKDDELIYKLVQNIYMGFGNNYSNIENYVNKIIEFYNGKYQWSINL